MDTSDIGAGWLGGCCGCLVGHPFDTIKTRTQLSAAASPLSCLRKLMRREGPTALYKGLPSPLLSFPLVNAVVFGAEGWAKDALLARRGATGGDLTGMEGCLTGAFAGAVNTVVVTPMELVKCRLQWCVINLSALKAGS